MPDLAVLIPTRGRPDNIRKVIAAWDFTNAWDHADMVLIADADDPEIQGYRDLVAETKHPDTGEALVRLVEMGTWMPMVNKLNEVAVDMAEGWPGLDGPYWALAFAGDDHIPQTINWAKRYLDVLAELGTGMVFGDDGFQGMNLSTEWAVTSDAVRTLGRMVPAPVEHMYCDNAIMELFDRAGAIRYLPEVRIEHMHPVAKKAATDAQYERVNSRDQFKKDGRVYDEWRAGRMDADILTLRTMRRGQVESRLSRENRQISPGSGPRPVTGRAKGPTMGRYPFPRHFKKVRAATPPEVGMALADFAAQVPADQAIVEIGVFQGWTALLMAWGAAQGGKAHVWGIDPWDLVGNSYPAPFNDPGSRSWANYNVMALGYKSGITLVQDFGVNAAQVWSGPKVGLIYVDGDHSYHGARQDIVAWSGHLADGATIAVDDYGHPDYPEVAQAVDDLVSEGFLQPVQVFHDRLAVTRLAGKDGPENPGQKPVTAGLTAITSEGVEPEPSSRSREELEAEWERVDPDGVAALRKSAAALDAEMSGGPIYVVEDSELNGVAGKTPIEALNTTQLRQLAKVRGIVLGARKDSRGAMLQALRDGK